jgi:hypothetical protein
VNGNYSAEGGGGNQRRLTKVRKLKSSNKFLPNREPYRINPATTRNAFLLWKKLMNTILLIILILLLIGALPTWPYSRGWGYYPTGGIGLILVIVIILALLGTI